MNARGRNPDYRSELSRAWGCLLGQLAGDALGSLVEFQSPEESRCSYPEGVRELADGGTWNTLAGQPTDDSEMGLLLARMLAERGTYDPAAALQAYRFWLDSKPFDCGATIATGLRGRPDPASQANGALMRISSLGIFGANHPLDTVADWARQDAALTHPNPVCLQANALFSRAIAHAIASGCEAGEQYQIIRRWAVDLAVEPALMEAILSVSAGKAPANPIPGLGTEPSSEHRMRPCCGPAPGTRFPCKPGTWRSLPDRAVVNL